MSRRAAAVESMWGPALDLAGLDAAVRGWCAGFDPDVVVGSDAVRVVETLAGMIRRLSAAQARAARRAERCRAYAGRARNAELWLAQQNGVSQGEAHRVLDTTRRLDSCPEAAEAFAAGELSLPEADAVSAAAVLDPGSEAALVAQARSSHDLKGLRAASDRVRHAARSGEDDQARHARLRAGRRWRQYQDSDGHVGVDARFAPLDYVHANAVLDAFTHAQAEQARRDGRRDRPDALRADAFIAALHAAGTTVGLTRPNEPTAPVEATTNRPVDQTELAATTLAPTTSADDLFDLIPSSMHIDVVVLVDAIALKRGYRAPGERCEILGFGDIPIEHAEQLMREHEVHMLIHDQVDIRAYANTTRHRPKPLDLALAVRDRDCNAGTCTAAPTEIDHTIDYSITHRTALDELGALCRLSHDEKTHRHSTLTRTTTHWLWWPPGIDPASQPPQVKAVGRHLNAWNLNHKPGQEPTDDQPDPDEPDEGDGNGLPPFDPG